MAALVSSTTVNAQITTDTEIHNYTINVTSGDPLVVALGNPGSGGFIPRMQIYMPGGSLVSDGTAAIGLGRTVSLTATQTGSYTIRIFEDGQDASGNYTLTAFALGTQTDSDTGVVESGRRFAASISPGDLDVWTITATAGQPISVIATENTAGGQVDLSVTLVAPDGSIVNSLSSETGVRIETTAAQTGTYYAVVSEAGANDSGVYGITFTRLPGPQYSGDPDTTFLAAGEMRLVQLPSGDADVWSFYAAAGVSINSAITATNGSAVNPQILLYGPTGALLDSGSGATFASVSATAPTSGNYWIVGRDLESDTGGPANFVYTLSSGNGGAPIVNGVLTINGTTGSDKITVTQNNSALDVVLNGATTSYPIGDVTSISVIGNDGNDNINLAAISIKAYVSGGNGDDTLSSGSGNDTLTGGAGKNRLFGGDGDDRLNGSGGRDFLNGEAGSDRLYGNGGNDVLDGGGNTDRLYGGDGDDALIGGSSNDRLYGEAGDDTLTGGSGADYLSGGDDADTFFARDGVIDTLDGGADSDIGDLDSNDVRTSLEVLT